MIETIKYDDDVSVIVFDEPIPEYREMMLSAASDNENDLRKNYAQNVLKDNLFMTIWTWQSDPAIIYGLYQDPDLPENTARAMNRFYRRWQHRDITKSKFKTNHKRNDQLDLNRTLYFYADHPEFHQSYGIDTLYITRNITEKTDHRSLEKYFQRYRKHRPDVKDYFIMEEDVRIYHTVPQRFFVWGDNSFLDSLPIDHSNN